MEKNGSRSGRCVRGQDVAELLPAADRQGGADERGMRERRRPRTRSRTGGRCSAGSGRPGSRTGGPAAHCGSEGQPHLLEHANVKVNLRREWVSHWPFAPTGHHSLFTPDRVVIADADWDMVDQLDEPRSSFAFPDSETNWSEAQCGFFASYTMWTYLTSPFILRRPGVRFEEIAPWTEAGQTWHRLRVLFFRPISPPTVLLRPSTSMTRGWCAGTTTTSRSSAVVPHPATSSAPLRYPE